jgi:hypothetical protein
VQHYHIALIRSLISEDQQMTFEEVVQTGTELHRDLPRASECVSCDLNRSTIKAEVFCPARLPVKVFRSEIQSRARRHRLNSRKVTGTVKRDREDALVTQNQLCVLDPGEIFSVPKLHISANLCWLRRRRSVQHLSAFVGKPNVGSECDLKVAFALSSDDCCLACEAY